VTLFSALAVWQSPRKKFRSFLQSFPYESGEGRGVTPSEGPLATPQLELELTLTRRQTAVETNRTGMSRTCSLLLRSRLRVTSGKDHTPLSLSPLPLFSPSSTLSLWTERSTQARSPTPTAVRLAPATLSQNLNFKPMAVVETCMFRPYSPRSSRPSLDGSGLLHRFLVNLLLERFELAQLG
jgi:hypothetical protein